MAGLLQPGMDAPTFKAKGVVNGVFKDVDLSSYKGKYVILLFYPEDFSWVCPTEIIAFSERSDEFRKLGAEVIALSTDTANSHYAFTLTERKKGGLGPVNIPLVGDPNHSISKAYGVLKEEDGVTFRGLFIIDGKGKVRQITINDFPVGRDVDETLRLLQAFKFTDEHGEVCPANWKPGKRTFKTTKEDISNYLANPES